MNECTYSAFWNQLINSDLSELRMSRTKFRDDYLYSFQLPSFSNKFEHGTKKIVLLSTSKYFQNQNWVWCESRNTL